MIKKRIAYQQFFLFINYLSFSMKPTTGLIVAIAFYHSDMPCETNNLIGIAKFIVVP